MVFLYHVAVLYKISFTTRPKIVFIGFAQIILMIGLSSTSHEKYNFKLLSVLHCVIYLHVKQIFLCSALSHTWTFIVQCKGSLLGIVMNKMYHDIWNKHIKVHKVGIQRTCHMKRRRFHLGAQVGLESGLGFGRAFGNWPPSALPLLRPECKAA